MKLQILIFIIFLNCLTSLAEPVKLKIEIISDMQTRCMAEYDPDKNVNWYGLTNTVLVKLYVFNLPKNYNYGDGNYTWHVEYTEDFKRWHLIGGYPDEEIDPPHTIFYWPLRYTNRYYRIVLTTLYD